MKQKSAFILLLALCPLLSLLQSCNNNNSRPKPDVGNSKVNIQIHRFDKELFSAKTADDVAAVSNRYGTFMRDYYDIFIRPEGGRVDTAGIVADSVFLFTQDVFVRRIQDSVNSMFPDLKKEEEEVSSAFSYFKYYFPKLVTPRVIAVNSVYGAGVSPFGDSTFIVGLDMFLGPANRDYDSVGVYAYLRHKMQRQYIARYLTDALYSYNFEPEELQPDRNLIEAIVDRGKKMYVLSYLFPDAPDSLILGYTQAQTDWCKQSELAIWQFFNDKDLLYKQNLMEQTRYLGEGPTTSGMPPEAPGSIGNYVGWQIVKAFMKETGGKVSLSDLVLKYDAKTVIAKARYRPAKR